jgi:hypothetical protein
VLCTGVTLPDIPAAQNLHTGVIEKEFDQRETTMTLDDVYGADNDRFPLEQEMKPIWAAEDLGLDWDETELERVASDLGVRRSLPA